MYVVIVNNKAQPPLQDLLPIIRHQFPNDLFSVVGTEDKGWKLILTGIGDELKPRKFAESYLKKWKPEPLSIIE